MNSFKPTHRIKSTDEMLAAYLKQQPAMKAKQNAGERTATGAAKVSKPCKSPTVPPPMAPIAQKAEDATYAKSKATATAAASASGMPLPPPPPTPPGLRVATNVAEQMRQTENEQHSASASANIIANGVHNVHIGNGHGHGNGSIATTTTAATTMERKLPPGLSWTNMRRKADDLAITTAWRGASSSPQTTRSYVSTASTATGVGSAPGGRLSGRTTAASGRISSSGGATISGSSNTLNDIISHYHHNQEANSNDYQLPTGMPGGSPLKNLSTSGSFNMTSGSTAKLLTANDDSSNQQTKWSVFRGLVLCICLNVTYANVVRFPRELDRYGSAYLIPYAVLLFLVGLPTMLLEISVGQFLGQGAAHTWRASPIFKGACIASRFASWLSTLWVSLQAVLGVTYAAMFLFNTLPFRECVGNLTLWPHGYNLTVNSGQECLQRTFLTPFWDNPFYFGILAVGLIFIWIVAMLCAHNSKILRRSIFCLGLFGLVLLSCLTGWEVHNSFLRSYFPELWPFDAALLYDSNIWFNALMQVLFATNCGYGVLPMITGKFLYKGDALRTSVVYLCFNLLINAIAVTLFMLQFGHSANSGGMIEELKPFTAIYDRILYDRPSNELLVKLLPFLIHLVILIAALMSVTVAIYTATRLVPRHPNYIVSLIALVMSIISLSAPKLMVGRIMDTRIVGTIAITALIFELIAITWIYGAKNIYTDLEFSIGRTVFKGWMCLWCISPAILTGLLVWWCSDDDQYDLLADYMPRWAPILFVLAVIFIVACEQIFHQVEYNFFGMICEASKPAKEWGPADPLARHAWKQWRSVCQDTGQRDFTLRRRGTRDYTHSIKKGQYSTSNKYANGNGHAQQQHWKSSTPGNSSPNYSGSMFGDSAIEEDISVDKFHGISAQHFVPFQANDGGKPLRYSHRSRTQQRIAAQAQQSSHNNERERQTGAPEKHREIVYIRRLSDEGQGQHATRIEITPSNESITYGAGSAVAGVGAGAGARNPLGRSGTAAQHTTNTNTNNTTTYVKRTAAANAHPTATAAAAASPENSNGDHICWRKFSVNAEEFSTEL